MSLKIKIVCLICFTLFQEVSPLNNRAQVINRPDIIKFFNDTDGFISTTKIDTNPESLKKAAKYALNLLNSAKDTDKKTIEPKIFSNKLVSLNKTKETLKFIIDIIKADKKSKYSYRILDPIFLNNYFKFIKWSGDVDGAKKHDKQIFDGAIYLTHYATFKLNGSYTKNSDYPFALYAIKNNLNNNWRYKISKQDVISGKLENSEYKNKILPLAWVTREGLEEALMQGTSIIKMPDNKELIVCVDKNNGLAYDNNIKDRKDQQRYWFFKVISKDKKFKKHNILNLGGVVFAGDLYNIGLGKIIAIRYKNRVNENTEIRLGVLADTGGAFVNNLYQLDFYGGIFSSYKEFYDWVWPMPKNVQAYVVIKK
ncbi:MAG: hypothetical protein SZ59_C0002G0018 [candidate division TM6 bacterium GW2011_GWF2_28_16]|nr:MAG: hypothetical protein SZ59_C0002G0018 [candidate division TM6 bacterium GW2011_GWF2_28_16]